MHLSDASNLAILFAIVASGITGVFVGGFARRPGARFLAGAIFGALVCGAILGVDLADDLSRILALVFYCPMCGLLSGFTAAVLGPGQRQRWVVAAIEEAGGDVEYDFESGYFERVPQWLSAWLGPDYLADVVIVKLAPSSTDTGLELLRGLTKLKELSLRGTQVSDAGLMHLRWLTNMNTLILGNTQVSDAGLVQLRGLTNMGTLDLDNTNVSDAGLMHLRRMTKLNTLILSNTQVSDAGLVQLRGLTNLEVLVLSGTTVTDLGCDRLKQTLPRCAIGR